MLSNLKNEKNKIITNSTSSKFKCSSYQKNLGTDKPQNKENIYN